MEGIKQFLPVPCKIISDQRVIIKDYNSGSGTSWEGNLFNIDTSYCYKLQMIARPRGSPGVIYSQP